MTTTDTTRPAAQLRWWSNQLTRLGQIRDGEWDQTSRRDLLAAALAVGAIGEYLDRAEWAREEYEMMLAALNGYLTKQERNREQAIDKFGAEARTYGVEQRISVTERLLDRVEDDYESRFGARVSAR